MKITILLFASLAERLDTRRLELELPEGACVRDAVDSLVRKHGAIAEARASLAVAVNDRIVGPDVPLREGDALALLPPVSGG